MPKVIFNLKKKQENLLFSFQQKRESFMKNVPFATTSCNVPSMSLETIDTDKSTSRSTPVLQKLPAIPTSLQGPRNSC